MASSKQAPTTKPLQRITWAEKNKNKKQWFKDMADYYIGSSQFRGLATQKANMKTMYEVYNNQIPTSWFNHVTDPLSAQDAKHRRFPAKIRPTNILRTDIDLLLGEWLRRPFRFRVENIGEDGYNKFLENLNGAVHQTITDMFKAYAQQELQAQGATEEEISQKAPEEVPLPEEVREKFHVSYKDKQAIRGQKWLTRALVEYGIRRKLHKMFKDWLIAGEAISYKNIHHGELEYRRLSPLYSDYDKSEDTDLIEDGEWFTHVFFMTHSDVVDMFYDELDEAGHQKLEAYKAGMTSPQVMYDYLSSTLSTEHNNKVPVYMTLWKGRKKIAYATLPDPVSGEMQEQVLDEAEIKLLPPGTKVKIDWVNEVYETWRIGEDLYCRMQPVPAQRNAMNCYSVCKLPANGRKYSDTHAENISVMQIGIPYLIMYMIIGRTLELTIAKSKGKILIMDNNAIPKTKGWNEEKFFYYSEALGYGLVDRNQIGVDKSFNQYTVLDMSLYENIEQLISLQAHYKQEWDDIIGISRQRKAQTQASETNASNERAIFQSTVITDMIFAGFDEFIESELQGLLDLSKFTNTEGTRRLYNGTELDDVLMEIDPVDYCSASLGVFATDNPQDYGALEAMKAQVGNMLQNGVKNSTILEVLQAGNIAELRSKLKQIEEIEQQIAQQTQQAEFDAQAQADERQMKFLEYEKMLEEQLINSEYDRKEDLEYIKGEIMLSSLGGDGDNNDNGIPDINEVIKNQTAREQMMSAERIADADRRSKERLEQGKRRLEEMKVKSDEAKAQREDKRKDKEHAQKMQLEAQKMKKAQVDIQKAKVQARKAAAPKPKPKK